MPNEEKKADRVEEANGQPPPIYAEHGDEPPPDYSAAGPSTGADAAPARSAPLTPHATFPPLMKIYYELSLSGLKTFYVCGATDQERLYAIDVHTGYSMKRPLGGRAGLHLHNGVTKSAPVIAATGNTFPIETRMSLRPLESIMLIPALPSSTGAEVFAVETLKAGTRPGDGVGFKFSVEVGEGEKMHREPFEWIKIEKGQEGLEKGGFKLVRHANRSPAPAGVSSSAGGQAASSSSASSSSSSSSDEGEVVALFTWTKTLTNPMHPFWLELKGSGQSGVLGQRWALMALMTALRLWALRLEALTNTKVVAMQEKFWHIG
ncbi:hypothetical protein BX600DRAFT_512296 [Xylariales sp. PMI_506]|nr:hypothetical protein BX600DRAFT_512296 [Xylariales sp. PMI_506]